MIMANNFDDDLFFEVTKNVIILFLKLFVPQLFSLTSRSWVNVHGNYDLASTRLSQCKLFSKPLKCKALFVFVFCLICLTEVVAVEAKH